MSYMPMGIIVTGSGYEGSVVIDHVEQYTSIQFFLDDLLRLLVKTDAEIAPGHELNELFSALAIII